MVRLNLLESPKTPKGVREITSVEEETSQGADREFTFDSVESIFTEKETKKTSPLSEEEPIDLEKSTVGVEEEAKSEFLEETIPSAKESVFSFDESVSRKRIFVVIGGVAAVLLIFWLLFTLFNPSPKPSAPVTASREKPVPETAAQQPASPLTQVYQRNMLENQYNLQTLQKLMTTRVKGVDYSLLIITPGKLYFSIIADSRDAIAQQHMKLKDAFPGMNFAIESVQSKFLNDRTRMVADFSGNFSPPSRVRPASQAPLAVNPISNIRSLFTRVARENALTVKYFKEGYRSSDRYSRKIFYYTTITGTKDRIMKFLNRLVSQYPQLQFAKISIYPFNLQSIDGEQLTARITLVLINPK